MALIYLLERWQRLAICLEAILAEQKPQAVFNDQIGQYSSTSIVDSPEHYRHPIVVSIRNHYPFKYTHEANQ